MHVTVAAGSGKIALVSCGECLATFLPLSHSMGRVPWDIAVGRWLALCAHPICAWRVRSTAVRAVVVTSYFTAAYLGGLVLLALVNP